MSLKKGEKVVCVQDYFRRYCAYPIKKGANYTVDGFYQCACGSRQVNLVEIPHTILMGCHCGQSAHRTQSYYTWRFKPLQYAALFGDVTAELEKVVEKNQAQARSLQKEIA